MDEMPYEVWAVIDTHNSDKSSSIVAVFTSERLLNEFCQYASVLINSGRFVIQPKVSVDPNFDITVSLK